MRSGGIGFLLTPPAFGRATVIALAAAGGLIGAAAARLAAVGAGAAVGGFGWWRFGEDFAKQVWAQLAAGYLAGGGALDVDG
jgi:hypothetical protein